MRISKRDRRIARKDKVRTLLRYMRRQLEAMEDAELDFAMIKMWQMQQSKREGTLVMTKDDIGHQCKN